MIAVDTNILVYAHRQDSPWHSAASARLSELVDGGDRWAVAWPCVHEFIAIVTHPRIYNPPTPLPVALECVEAWSASPSLHLLSESEGYWDKLRKLATAARSAGPIIHDLRIAALCLHHGVRMLWSADRDFSRVTGLRVVNPLI